MLVFFSHCCKGDVTSLKLPQIFENLHLCDHEGLLETDKLWANTKRKKLQSSLAKNETMNNYLSV